MRNKPLKVKSQAKNLTSPKVRTRNSARSQRMPPRKRRRRPLQKPRKKPPHLLRLLCTKNTIISTLEKLKLQEALLKIPTIMIQILLPCMMMDMFTLMMPVISSGNMREDQLLSIKKQPDLTHTH